MSIDSPQKHAIAGLLEWNAELGVETLLGERPLDFVTKPPRQRTGKAEAAGSRLVPPGDPGPPAGSRVVGSRVVGSRPVGSRVVVPASDPAGLPDMSAIVTLDQLRQALEAFEGCKLKGGARNTVFGDGEAKAGLMIIGEAPGAEEDAQARPFVGPSGKLLDRMLAGIGIEGRHAYYITNIVPWRPPRNRQPTTEEIEQCRPFLERHIELVAPRVIFALGSIAVKTLIGKEKTITNIRGTIFSYRSVAEDKARSVAEDAEDRAVCPPLALQTAQDGGAYESRAWSDREAGPISSDEHDKGRKNAGLVNRKEEILLLASWHPAFLLRTPAQKAGAWKDLLVLKRILTRGDP